MRRKKQWLLGIVAMAMLVYTCKVTQRVVQRDENGNIIADKNPSTEPLSPRESLKKMYLQKGYRLELVASEPMIHEPVAIAWDGNGRLFVAEMNTYMQDIDGKNQMSPICSVKRLEDTNGDGVMDKSVIFIDSLVLPRMLLTLDDRLIVSETNVKHLYSYRDTNGDGVADEKKLIFRNDEVSRNNLEHQRSGLIWNLDNKIYVTYENVRYVYDRLNDVFKTESLIEGSRGQWGLTNDDYGRLFYSQAGSEVPALDFQQNPFYGRLDLKNQYSREFLEVWPIISTPDVQGGVGRLRPADSTLNHFTAVAGQSIYRGNSLPADLKGDLLIPEPVGRLIRRAKVINTDGKITLENAYQKEEFIASADMNFRPVNTATGPDGCLYIVDMYRGIIQEGNWTRPGSFLRRQILGRQLDKNIGRGRIYRLVHDDIKPDKTLPRMLSLPSSQLIKYLSHPNGWWRDNAQKLMVVRGDKSVAPQLAAVATTSESELARIHALWTLKGLDALNDETLMLALKDKAAQVRRTAVWISEEEAIKGNEQVIKALEALKRDPSADVRFQLALSLRFSKSETAQNLVKELLTLNTGNELMAESQKKYEEGIRARALAEENSKTMTAEEQRLVQRGAVFFNQLCVTCHGADGKGVLNQNKEMPAPPLAGSKNVNGDPEKLVKVLLHGLTGPVEGKVYSDIMPPLGGNDDQYIASVLSYIRKNLAGNNAPIVKPSDVKKVRDATAGRSKFWTWAELNQ